MDRKRQWNALISGAMLVALLVPSHADTTAVSQPYYYEPRPMSSGQHVIQLGVSFTILPLPVVEDEYPAPMIDAQFKYALSSAFCLAAVGSTNIFSNVLHGGLQWNTAIDRFSIGAALHAGGFYGYMSTEGQFDRNAAYALIGIPMLRVGIRLDDFALSTSLGASYVIVSGTTVSGMRAAGPTRTINDVFVTIAVEQPFIGSTMASVGITLSYARTPFHTWMLHNTIDAYLYTPEFFFAVQL
jgi:hypothetical protein